jgi:hypothetical protein
MVTIVASRITISWHVRMRTSAIVDALRAMVGRRSGGAAVTDEVMGLIDPFGMERKRVKVEAASANNTEGPSGSQVDFGDEFDDSDDSHRRGADPATETS